MPDDMNNINNTTKSSLKSTSVFPPLDYRSTAQVVVEVAFACIILVSAALGNFLMMLVMYKKKQLRTIPNIFVLNLSVGNFLLAVTVLPVFAWTLEKGEWTFGATLCVIQGYQNYILFALTLFTLTAISLNRYMLICYPNKYRVIFDKKLVLKIICCIWICCVASCSPPLFGWGHYSFNPRTALCHTDNTSSSFKITANIFMLIDIIIVVFCNVKIVKVVNGHRRKIAARQTFSMTELPKEGKQGITKEMPDTSRKQRAKVSFKDFNSLGAQKEQKKWQTKEHLGPSDNQSGIIAVRFVYVCQKQEDCTAEDIKSIDFNAVNKHERGHYDSSHAVCFNSKNTTEQAVESKHEQLQTKEARGDDIHITRTISLIVFSFCFCWLPCFIMDSMDACGVFPPRNVRMAGIYLIFLDSVVGPFIYGIRNRKLRKAFMEVLRCDS